MRPHHSHENFQKIRIDYEMLHRKDFRDFGFYPFERVRSEEREREGGEVKLNQITL